MKAIDLEVLKSMTLSVAERIIEQKDLLTKADQDLGDGDHGIGMARGYIAVQEKLKDENSTTISEFLSLIGTTLMMSMGGSSGAIFGTLYRAGSKNMSSDTEFSAKDLSSFLADGLEAIQKRGGAKVGDKTMIDALSAAVATAKTCENEDVSKALETVAQAAADGVEKTKNMVAMTGRAKTLGERCIGFPDPGAMSTAFILQYMSDFTKAK